MKLVQSLQLFILCMCFSNLTVSAQSPNRLDSKHTSSTSTLTSKTLDDNIPEWFHLMNIENPNYYDVVDAYDLYYQTHEFKKTEYTRAYKRWVSNVYSHVNEQGYIQKKPSAQIISKLKEEATEKKSASSSWTNIGPYNTYNNDGEPFPFQANVFCIDQSKTNPNILLCGTQNGGVFKSTNKGMSWFALAEQTTMKTKITAVAIRPDNEDHLFAGGRGILYFSQNGGANWIPEFTFGTGENSILEEIYEIKFDPNNSNHILVATGRGLWETYDQNTWTQRSTSKVWDIDFHPTKPNIVYVASSIIQNGNNIYSLLKSTNSGQNYLQKTSGFFNEAYNFKEGAKLAVSPDDPDRVYVALLGSRVSNAADNGWLGVYRSDDEGENWQLQSASGIGADAPYSGNCSAWPFNPSAYNCDSSAGGQYFYNFDLEASPSDADLLWMGTVRLVESTDGGSTFDYVGGPRGPSPQPTPRMNVHPDIQAIHIQGSDVWVATDGGLYYSNDDFQTAESRNYKLTGTEFWGFSGGWNDDVLAGSKNHNGNTAYYELYNEHDFRFLGGGEPSTGYVNPFDNFSTYFGRTNNDNNNVSDRYTIPKAIADPVISTVMNFKPNESFEPGNSSGLYHHPYYSNHMIGGKFSKVWKSVDDGENWVELYDFGGDSRVLEMVYARSEPNWIYANVRFPNNDGRIYRSEDGGVSWNQLTNVPATNRRSLQITVDPSFALSIFVASQDAANGEKLFKSSDGGASWTNISSDIVTGESVFDDQKVYDIAYQGGTTDIVYAVADHGFYYWNGLGWVSYDADLPYTNRASLNMHLFYRDKKIRLPTRGRGVWEVDFPVSFSPLALPMTRSNTVACGDIVQFESHSMVDQEGTRWEWSFSPQPSWIDDAYKRNPSAIFATNGNITVTLKIMNSAGQSDTRTVTNMIQVNGTCNPDWSIHNRATLEANSCIALTLDGNLGHEGAAWNFNTLNLRQSFDLSFDIELGDIDGNVSAEGATFMLQRQGFDDIILNSLGTQNISPAIAIAFRTNLADRMEVWLNGNGCCGNDIPINPVPISGNGPIPVRVTWVASSKELTIDWNDDNVDQMIIDGDDINGSDIINEIFSGDPKGVIWGFTAANGNQTADHIVCNIVMTVTDDPNQTPQTVYVKEVPEGLGDGSSWQNATGLQNALDMVVYGDSIFVAAGTYYPSLCDQSIAFEMHDGVVMLGGFPDTGNPTLSDRDWIAHKSILDGNIGDTNNASDNSTNVLRAVDVSDATVLDGFEIKSATLAILSNDSDTRISNCAFYDHHNPGGFGSAIFFNNGSESFVENCKFYNNTSAFGGAIRVRANSVLNMVNAIFYNNLATSSGGAIEFENSDGFITNCTFTQNTAQTSNAISARISSTVELVNTILWKNGNQDVVASSSSTVTASHCILGTTTDIVDLGMNVFDDPLFVHQSMDPINDPISNLSLTLESPAIDAGTSNGAPTNDLDGNLRPQGQGVDIGAYESEGLNECASSYINDTELSGINTTSYKAVGEIHSTQTIPSPNQVLYKSETAVLLKQDFEVEVGAVFDAIIENCESLSSLIDANTTVQTIGDGPSPSNEGVENIIDGDISTKFLKFPNSQLDLNFLVDFGIPKSCELISFSTANDFPIRDPISFTLFGSNDNSNFVQLGNTIQIECEASRFYTRYLDIDNTTSYRYYRFDVNTMCDPNQGESILQLAEVNMYGYQ